MNSPTCLSEATASASSSDDATLSCVGWARTEVVFAAYADGGRRVLGFPPSNNCRTVTRAARALRLVVRVVSRAWHQ